MALSENIKARRSQLKMSQEYVADQLGISRQAVAKWESGKSQPSSANLAALVALFEMDISELADPEKYAGERQAQELRSKERKRGCMARTLCHIIGWQFLGLALCCFLSHLWIWRKSIGWKKSRWRLVPQ